MLLSPQHVGFGDLPDLMGNLQMYGKGFVDSGYLRHMTGNIAYLSNFKEFDGGHVTFGGGAYGGRISGKESECLVLSPDFKLPDENQILLRIPREDNMYSFDMKNIVPKNSLTCLAAKATLDESMLWHKRLGHINFKNINKLVKENLVRGLPLKRFENDQTGVACLKGKQHRASCKSKLMNPITKPLFRLHMDLFGLTFVSSLMHKRYCLVITDDYSRFTWVFFLETKDETCEILKNFIIQIENLVEQKVKIIRCDNRIEFKNKVMDEFCKEKDNLGKFDGKSNEGFFVGYSLSSKAFRVYNTRTKKVEENLHIGFLENKPMIDRNGQKWLFDIDSLTQSMNYVLVTVGTSINKSAGTQGVQNAGLTGQEYIVMPIWKDASYFDSSSKTVEDGPSSEDNVNTASPGISTGGIKLNTVGSSVNTAIPEDIMGSSHSFEAPNDDSLHEEDDTEVDLGNILQSYTVPTTPHTRVHINHPLSNTHEDLHTCLFACFLSPEEPKRISKALSDPAWVEAMQEKLLQFKLQKVWILVDLPKGHKAIGTKWVFRNKKDEREIVIRNKARLIAQGHTQEEGIDYDEFFAPIEIIEAIRLFLAYASFMGFMVYQMDVKSAFLYGQIEEEVYVCQPPGFEDPNYPDEVYKVIKMTLSLALQRRNCQRKDGIFISQDKYVDEILRKFNYTDVKTASTLVDLEKHLVKDGDGTNDDEHLYRSMIRSLMYLTASRPDIMFVVCACARFQVAPKASHLLAVKRIFRYLKGKPALGLCYPRDSPFELVTYTDSDYAGATQDRKSTIGGCQFLGNRLISWQCKKQTVVATSTTKAKYVAAAS
ncbi:putative ribonuclease H-like domain-containing protein [Tanacetum coccineum]